MIPDKIKCALCGTEFRVEVFTKAGRMSGDLTSCKARRPDNSICGRIFQHAAQKRNDPVIMRVSPEDIECIWRESQGL